MAAVVAAAALALTTAAAACGDRDGVGLGDYSLTDLGGSDRPHDVAGAPDASGDATGDAAGETAGGVADTAKAPDVSDTATAPADLGPPPDTGVSLAPDCPATGADWSVWFSKSVQPSAVPAAPPACGDVRLDRALAWWLRRATTSVDIAVYSLDAKAVADALVAAHEAGVAVRVIVDDDNGADATGSRVAALLEAGVAVRTDDDRNRLMHHKFAVADGERVWLGSANASTYDGAANANNSLTFTSTALAQAYGAEFDDLWAGGFHDDKGGPRALTLAGGAAALYLSPDGGVEDELLRLIHGADHEIYVGLFAFTRQRLADALVDRCGEVDVVVLLDEQALSDGATASFPLCAAGVLLGDDVQPSGGLDWPLTLHHKYMVVDGRHPDSDPVVVTGSMNWSQNGLFHNDEATLVWHHADAAAAFVQEFAARVEEAGGLLPAP